MILWRGYALGLANRKATRLFTVRSLDAALRRGARWQWVFDHDGANTGVAVTVVEVGP